MRHEYWPTKGNVPVMQGSRPWSGGEKADKKSVDPNKLPRYDSQEQIEDCLWCWKPDCNNCMDWNKKRRKGSMEIPDRFRADVLDGMTVPKLAEKYHVSTNTISRWKKREGVSKEKSAKEEQSSNQAESKTLLP